MLAVLAFAAIVAQPPDPALWMDLHAWHFHADPEGVGLAEGWHEQGFDDSSWPKVMTGARWEEQGFADVDGYAWYRYTFTVPEAWREQPLWFLANGINDSAELYLNGRLVNVFGDTEESFAQIAVWSHLPNLHTEQPNVLAIRVHDWGGSGGLWRFPVAITPSPHYVPDETMVALHTGPERDILKASVDFRGLGSLQELATVHVVVTHPKHERPIRVATPLNHAAGTVRVPVLDVQPGDELGVQIQALDEHAGTIANMTIDARFIWPEPPGWGPEFPDLEVRNNFVTLLHEGETGEDVPAVEFENPREGWVFLSWSGDGHVAATVNGSNVVWRVNPDDGAREAMRYLEPGGQKLEMDAAKGRLRVHAVPELSFCYYPTTPHIAGYGRYDWSFMERHVLPHVNTLVARSDIDAAEFRRWIEEGRQWISNANLPGVAGPAPTADEVVEVWATNPGVTEREFAGIIADEFLGHSDRHYAAWTEAVRRIHAMPEFESKTFYAWCGDLYMHTPANVFVQALLSWGDRFAWERYQQEEPTAEAAERRFVREITQPWLRWKQAQPGLSERMILCLGYLSAPPETLNVNPHVDYHVFMDMQFHALATDPAFWNVYGIMEYAASYADEESLRWAHRLFRHYCIEGNTERLTQDPYELTHIQNADFTHDLSGWTVKFADEGSIVRRSMDGFSWLQGRYPRTAMGDSYCLFTRSAVMPNRISQPMKALEPGRTYSVKLISADIDDFHRSQELGLSLTVEGADVVPALSFQSIYPSNYAHELPPYTAEAPAHFNLHRLVFRATAPSATLTISDWSDGEPAGPEGQRIAFNFVEVQPFR